MSAVLQFVAKQQQTSCSNCGVIFSAPEDFIDSRRSDGRTFYCPNGHSLSWHETEADRLRKQVASKEQEIERERNRTKFYREQSDSKDRQLVAQKGQMTKLKNRVAKGVCPCCNRQFQDLLRHMTSKHPDFQKVDGEK